MIAMAEIKKLYYSISEVARLTGLKPYVLRYWETEFSQLRPRKNSAGRRSYTQSDIDLVLEIQRLMHTERYTIKGARAALSARDDAQDRALSQREALKEARSVLVSLLAYGSPPTRP